MKTKMDEDKAIRSFHSWLLEEHENDFIQFLNGDGEITLKMWMDFCQWYDAQEYRWRKCWRRNADGT